MRMRRQPISTGRTPTNKCPWCPDYGSQCERVLKTEELQLFGVDLQGDRKHTFVSSLISHVTGTDASKLAVSQMHLDIGYHRNICSPTEYLLCS